MNSNKSSISIFSSDNSPAPSPADPLKLFKEALNDGVNQIQSHPDMCCSAMLSALSIAAQGLINVQTLEGRAKPVSICTLTSARSGDRKTSTDNYYFVR
ncbi:DUF3987 domain-containing protein [Lampropedia aestuarii]|uniref:DUF3987 domain-containing protein n=1 Tax=Lampropedia aestuarii TaxID=2562762 RepID=UPI002469A864|nr:DUF3987 domain-containing protein [Lampropedia aestuarii]MDH5856461.1 DUF3987 domain-containing protein [Lampropedia aestuarii]